MMITRSAEQRKSENTTSTAPVRDCEIFENPIDYLYIRHHRYDIYRYHRNRQIIVINEVEFRTVVLHSHGTSVSCIGLKGSITSCSTSQRHFPPIYSFIMYDSLYSEISHSMAYGQTISVRDLT